MALAGDKYYRAMTPQQIADARAGNWRIRVTPTKAVPQHWFDSSADSPDVSDVSFAGSPDGGLAGRKVLCLAGGGGQQAPILAALGADVTVFDLSEQQLQRDSEIAQREGLTIKCVSGDMRDLSCFEPQTFDLIVSPCATCFCPSVAEIWQSCFRVLLPGGKLIVGFINPIYYLFDAVQMDRGNLKVRHSIPYCDFDLPETERLELLGERPLEYGHSLDDLLGQQLATGLQLVGFYEDAWGGSDRLSTLTDVFIATASVRPH